MRQNTGFSKKLISAVIFSAAAIYAALNNYYFSDVQAQNFTEAKKNLTTIYRYAENPVTFYCNCPIIIDSKKHLLPNLEACGYVPGKLKSRAERIEWEHIMPASWLGNQLKCWQNGGRKNCAKDRVFAEREGDMHNLVPAIGEINAIRSNYRYAILDSSLPKFNSCDFVVSNKEPKSVQPAPYTRGFIARAFLYMSDKYKIHLSKQNQKMMEAWNEKYDVTPWECRRNSVIEEMQGNDNKFITEKCKKRGLK